MRAAKERRFYAVEGDDGKPRAMHATPGSQPEGAIEITKEQAAAISAALDHPGKPEKKSNSDFVSRPEMDARIKSEIKAVLAQLAGGADADQ